MDSVLHHRGRFGPRTLLITTAAVPLTGWAVHAVALHKRLAATRTDSLTGLLRRDTYTARARRLLARHGNDTAVVMIDADHVDRTTGEHLSVSGAASTHSSVRVMQLSEGGAACLHPVRSTGISDRFVSLSGGASCLPMT